MSTPSNSNPVNIMPNNPANPGFTTPSPATPGAKSTYLSFDFLLQFSYPIAFIGAVFFGVASIVNFDPATVIANKNATVFINVLIGVTGLIGLFNWFNFTPIPVIGPYILPNGQGVLKQQAV